MFDDFPARFSPVKRPPSDLQKTAEPRLSASIALPRFMYTDRTLWKKRAGKSSNMVTLPRLERHAQRDKVPRVPLLEKEHAELVETLASAEQARVDAESSAAELEAALQR